MNITPDTHDISQASKEAWLIAGVVSLGVTVVVAGIAWSIFKFHSCSVILHDLWYCLQQAV